MAADTAAAAWGRMLTVKKWSVQVVKVRVALSFVLVSFEAIQAPLGQVLHLQRLDWPAYCCC
jgi:hypothetical protein